MLDSFNGEAKGRKGDCTTAANTEEIIVSATAKPAAPTHRTCTSCTLVSDMFSLHRISLLLVVAMVLHDGVFVCCDDETGPPFDEDDGPEECNDDTIVCDVSEAVVSLL